VSTFYRFDGTISNAIGQAIEGAYIYVCTQPATTSNIPPSPLATIYSNSTGTALANPTVADGNGNFFFYSAVGVYTLVYFDPFGRIPTQVFLDQQVVSPGGGTVTSVAMTGDGVIFNSTITGSPITSSGTLVPSLLTKNPNFVFVGPASGGTAAPTFRVLVAADIPSAASSAIGGLKLTNDLGGTSSSPTVVATHLASVLPIAQGGRGSTDAKGNVSGAITFDGATNSVFTMTLIGDTTSTFSGGVTGQLYTFVITQDGSGNHTFGWPAVAKGANSVAPDVSLTSVQSFVFNGSFLIAIAPGLTMA
jgi:hypothetical protein